MSELNPNPTVIVLGGINGAGNLTVTLASPTGELKSGDNELTITIADSSGNPLDVGAAAAGIDFYK